MADVEALAQAGWAQVQERGYTELPKGLSRADLERWMDRMIELERDADMGQSPA